MTDRYLDVVLSDPSHRLPMPGTARLFSADGEKVDSWDGFWLMLMADGSIKPKPAPAPAIVIKPAS
jgi:hypothetical protein